MPAAAADKLKETLKGEDDEQIKADTEALTTPLYELSAALYKDAEAAGAEPAGADAAPKKKQDNVVDAEVVDEDKK